VKIYYQISFPLPGVGCWDMQWACFEKDLEVDANYRRLLGWDVLCWCSTFAKVWLCEYR
jgi:hypothetical protein